MRHAWLFSTKYSVGRRDGGRAALGRAADRAKDTAKLVAPGWTNREIAEELYVSTVEHHLGNMYAKSGLRNRRQLRNLVQKLSA
ncbi:response regulator transcription factor [Streptomyces sp. NPDC057301]|uniref:response regulator transcription factor n=1 Tax=Streptomyces sp. NPDC057301 TaxID=3346093 RepID=UPI00363BC90F